MRKEYGISCEVGNGRLSAGVLKNKRVASHTILDMYRIENTDVILQHLKVGELYFMEVLQTMDVGHMVASPCISEMESPCGFEARFPDSFGIRYADKLKRKLQGENIELPDGRFAVIAALYFTPEQAKQW